MAETFLSPPALLPRDVPRLRGVCNALPCEEPWVRPLGGLVPPRLAALYGLVSKEAERELVAPLDGGEATLVPLTPWVGGREVDFEVGRHDELHRAVVRGALFGGVSGARSHRSKEAS